MKDINLKKKILITGGAGFIGSHLVEQALQKGYNVRVIDNLSTGKPENLSPYSHLPNFSFLQGDLLNSDDLNNGLEEIDHVIHLAGNPDTRKGIKNPTIDFQQNIQSTFMLLEGMRQKNIKSISFASSATIYGNNCDIPLKEDAIMYPQTSPYAASKLSCEALITAYCHQYGMKCSILRLATALGERYAHGHVNDFYQKLLNNPAQLEVEGDGTQKKNFVYAGDIANAFLQTLDHREGKNINILNVATKEIFSLNDSIKWICDELNLKPNVIYKMNNQDLTWENPLRIQSTERIEQTGWKPQTNIENAIRKTIRHLSKSNKL